MLFSSLLLSAPVAAQETATVTSWSIEPGNNAMLLRWETGNEIDSIAFNIYRGQSNDIVKAVKLTKRAIPSQVPGSATGASYEYLDKTAKAGKTYYYWLEHVLSGSPDGGLFLMSIYELGAARWSKPQALRVNPAAGGKAHNLTQRFTATFRDLDADLATVYMLIGDGPTLSGSMALRYEVATGLLSLYDERQGGWQEGIQAQTAANLRCTWGTLNGMASRIYTAEQGATLRVGWVVRFTQPFVGPHTIYIMAEDSAGNSSGWQEAGNWEVQ